MVTESDVCSTAAASRARSTARARSSAASRTTVTSPVIVPSASRTGEIEASTTRFVPSRRRMTPSPLHDAPADTVRCIASVAAGDCRLPKTLALPPIDSSRRRPLNRSKAG